MAFKRNSVARSSVRTEPPVMAATLSASGPAAASCGVQLSRRNARTWLRNSSYSALYRRFTAWPSTDARFPGHHSRVRHYQVSETDVKARARRVADADAMSGMCEAGRATLVDRFPFRLRHGSERAQP